MNSREPRVIQRLAEDLRRIGLQSGDLVVMHSSFKTMGLNDGTPSDVIETLLSVLGKEGTLVVPTFTYSYAGVWQAEPFDAQKTPGRLNGVLSETLRRNPCAFRSAHPTYSVAAVGRHAEAITKDRESAAPLGRGSSYETVVQLGGRILLLGVGNKRNSALHYAEVVADLPYNDIPFRECWGRTALIKRQGKIVDVSLPAEFPACSANFGVVDEYLQQAGVANHGTVAAAKTMLMNAADTVEAVVRRLRQQPDWLLCEDFTCEPCTLRRRCLKDRSLI